MPSYNTLTWYDEFNGATLDATKWEAIEHTAAYLCVQGAFRPGNATVTGGSLVITTKAESYAGFDYTSGYVHAFGKMNFTYGKLEIRAKMPKSQGYWPCIWMLPTQAVFDNTWPPTGGKYGAWPISGELDIAEGIGQHPTFPHPGMHVGNPHDTNVDFTTQYAGGLDCSTWHIYTLERSPYEIRWSIDGVVVKTQRDWFSSGGVYPAPYDGPFYLIICTQLGGSLPDWPGYIDGTTIFPQTLEVDYVRLYT
jgi:beta-glucanase (GH16 family)